MKFEPQSMVSWYNVYQLISTGVKTLVSSVFGSYADRREMQAAIRITTDHAYAEKEEIWVDYIADLGDGFDSTFTLAHLLAKPMLQSGEGTIPRGDILIMGGDQVYPVATKADYQNRLQGPYESAFPTSKLDENRPHLFAIPGNHDWYDGLTNFTRLFCQERMIGNWRTRQERSYWAIQLPHNWWIWGIDIQLDADIDKPQLDYFKRVATEQMKKGDRVILCTAEPSWIHTTYRSPLSYENLRFFEENLIAQNGLELAVTLAGDIHCYARYSLEENQASHKIISGGGGAFMHPTHNLADELQLREGKFQLETCFPDPKTSRNISWNIWKFPAFNWRFVVFLGVFYVLFAWMLESSGMHQDATFLRAIGQIAPEESGALGQVGLHILNVLRYSPFTTLLVVAMIAGFTLFTDSKTNRLRYAWLAGLIHGIVQIVVLLLFIWLFAYLNFDMDPTFFDPQTFQPGKVALFTLEMFVFGGFTGAFVMGMYLFLSNRLLRIHDTEAFSSLKWRHYKNFLRMHISAAGLTIYPVGVRHVPHWKRKGDQFEADQAPVWELIEQPITLAAVSGESASTQPG